MVASGVSPSTQAAGRLLGDERPTAPGETPAMHPEKAAPSRRRLILTLGGLTAFAPLSDALGRRRPLLIGLVAYTLASILCATAPSIGALVAFRFVQGFAGAA